MLFLVAGAITEVMMLTRVVPIWVVGDVMPIVCAVVNVITSSGLGVKIWGPVTRICELHTTEMVSEVTMVHGSLIVVEIPVLVRVWSIRVIGERDAAGGLLVSGGRSIHEVFH
jgi:hypothetical protein